MEQQGTTPLLDMLCKEVSEYAWENEQSCILVVFPQNCNQDADYFFHEAVCTFKKGFTGEDGKIRSKFDGGKLKSLGVKTRWLVLKNSTSVRVIVTDSLVLLARCTSNDILYLAYPDKYSYREIRSINQSMKSNVRGSKPKIPDCFSSAFCSICHESLWKCECTSKSPAKQWFNVPELPKFLDPNSLLSAPYTDPEELKIGGKEFASYIKNVITTGKVSP